MCFHSRCLGNFEVAAQWSDATFIDFSKDKRCLEEESTAAETEEDTSATHMDPRLRAEADREKRAFFTSRFSTSMLCHSALNQLLAEYKCKLPDDTNFSRKTEALREAAKHRFANEDFHEQPWRWLDRIRRVLRNTEQPWLQVSALNDRLGFDKAGVPVTKKRIAQCEEKVSGSDLFCFMEYSQCAMAAEGTDIKTNKELFV